MSYCIINCTVENKSTAVEISKKLLSKKLIACCSIIPSVLSVYHWKGEVKEDNEVLMVMKTETELFSAIEEEIKKMHSYDIPEIICIPIINGNREYLDWVDKETKNVKKRLI